MKTSLGDLAEGTIVPMLERGSKVNYIVAKHNYQSDVNGGGHTMLIRAGVLGSYKWENSNSSSYELPEYAKYDTDSKIPDVLENSRMVSLLGWIRRVMGSWGCRFSTPSSTS